MKKTNAVNMYEGLASYFLPEGILEYFEVTGFTEEPTRDVGVLYKTELHIYLDERDNRTAEMAGSLSHGYGEEFCMVDFPARDKKAVLHIRRRRWKMPDGTSIQVKLDGKIELKHPGTRLSKDFALFLKMADGQRDSHCAPDRSHVHDQQLDVRKEVQGHTE